MASIQIVFVPCGITAKTTDEERKAIYAKVTELVALLKKSGVRAHADLRDNYTAGWKFSHWELKGVPLRCEIGPRDLQKSQVTIVTRFNRSVINMDSKKESFPAEISATLESIQDQMFQKAKIERDDHLKRVDNWADFTPTLNKKNLVLVPWCESGICEDAIKKDRYSTCFDLNLVPDKNRTNALLQWVQKSSANQCGC